MKTQNTIESKELPAFRVHLDDGTSYVTSMAHGVTLADARAYFVGSVQTEENEETGKETRRIVSSVEAAGEDGTDRALSQYDARVAELEAEGCTTSDAQSVADAEREKYPRFEVRTDAADHIGDHIEGYGEKLVSVHSTEAEAEKALPAAQKAARHGHNRAQVWKAINSNDAFGGASITW